MEDSIQVVDYDANWSIRFEQEKSQILNALGDAVLDIQHIGSTSVPGLAAKPIIDIVVGVEELPPSPTHIKALETLGYVYQGEAGIPGRHFFRKGMPRTHHLHLVKLEMKFGKTNFYSAIFSSTTQTRRSNTKL
jgi:GrpB-like predicted nucleotidyltransferase (UPF0157 family)